MMYDVYTYTGYYGEGGTRTAGCVINLQKIHKHAHHWNFSHYFGIPTQQTWMASHQLRMVHAWLIKLRLDLDGVCAVCVCCVCVCVCMYVCVCVYLCACVLCVCVKKCDLVLFKLCVCLFVYVI